MLELTNLNKTYGNSFKAVDNLNIKVGKGQISGFVGENGAGKTTTIKMMTGILKPDSGNIIINSVNLLNDPIMAKKSIAYVADNPDMFLRLKGMEYLQLMADIYEVSSVKRKERIRLLSERFDMYDSLSYHMSDYSHGMRQKLMIIAALLHEPPVWILDEPMTGLDPRSAFELKKMMKEHAASGNCVFFSTHVLEVAEELCDVIFIIRKGKLVFSGSLSELRSRFPEKSLEEIFIILNTTEV